MGFDELVRHWKVKSLHCNKNGVSIWLLSSAYLASTRYWRPWGRVPHHAKCEAIGSVQIRNTHRGVLNDAMEGCLTLLASYVIRSPLKGCVLDLPQNHLPCSGAARVQRVLVFSDVSGPRIGGCSQACGRAAAGDFCVGSSQVRWSKIYGRAGQGDSADWGMLRPSAWGEGESRCRKASEGSGKRGRSCRVMGGVLPVFHVFPCGLCDYR